MNLHDALRLLLAFVLAVTLLLPVGRINADGIYWLDTIDAVVPTSTQTAWATLSVAVYISFILTLRLNKMDTVFGGRHVVTFQVVALQISVGAVSVLPHIIHAAEILPLSADNTLAVATSMAPSFYLLVFANSLTAVGLVYQAYFV